MIRLKSLLTEDKEPGDVELGKWVLSAKNLSAELQAKVKDIKNSPQYKAGDIDYARVVQQLGRKALLNAYNSVKEQAQIGGMQSPFKKTSTAGTTTITGLQLKQATIKREGMYVKVSFGRDDMEESSYADLDLNGTCDILLFMKNGEIDYSNAYCVDEQGGDYAGMQKFGEFRLDLLAAADTNNFSQDILTAFEK